MTPERLKEIEARIKDGGRTRTEAELLAEVHRLRAGIGEVLTNYDAGAADMLADGETMTPEGEWVEATMEPLRALLDGGTP